MSILETVLSHETVVPMEKLTDITVTEDTNCLELDMTNNRWAEFNFVVLRFTPKDGEAVAFRIRLNNYESCAHHRNMSANYGTSNDLILGSLDSGVLALIFVSRGALAGTFGYLMHKKHYQIDTDIGPSQFERLTIFQPEVSAPKIKAGSIFEIWGIL